MMKKWGYPMLAMGVGLLGALLRAGQMATGFEDRTGLPIAGNGYGYGLLVLFAVCMVILVKKQPGAKREKTVDFSKGFFLNNTTVTLVVAGAFLLIASGAVLCKDAFGVSQLHLVTGLLIVFGGVGLLSVVGIGKRHGTVDGTYLLISVMAVVVLLIISYREVSINPVIWAYGTEILALSVVLLVLFQLSAFAFGQGKAHGFCRFATVAVVLCCVTLMDGHALPYTLFFAGSGVLLFGFLVAASDRLARGIERELPKEEA